MSQIPLRPRQVHPVSLAQLVAVFPQLTLVAGGSSQSVAGVAQASQQVRPGDLYLALPGTRVHGAAFAEQAAAAGATAMVTDPAGLRASQSVENMVPTLVTNNPRALAGPLAAHIYDDPTADLTVIGITGTNGKTTTSYLVDAALRAVGQHTAVIGTVGVKINQRVVPSAFTTPEAAELQGLFAYAREHGVTAVVMEVSSHALALDRAAGTRFAVGIFTNLSMDHLDFHADMVDYFAAKARLFDGRCRHEIVNIDDEAGRQLVRPKTVTFSIDGGTPWTPGQWHAQLITTERWGQRFTVVDPSGGHHEAFIGLPGRFNVANAMAAIATATTLGVPLSTAISGIAAMPGVPGRMERVGISDDVLAIVDYAHAPDGVAKALATLRPITKGRLICVLGCGGDRDQGKRPFMGAAAIAGADLFIATDDNPRGEDPAAIREAMLVGVDQVRPADRAEVVEIADRRQAIIAAVARANPGDTIAVLGKGHEPGQEIAGVTYPFDDRTVLAEALGQRQGKR